MKSEREICRFWDIWLANSIIIGRKKHSWNWEGKFENHPGGQLHRCIDASKEKVQLGCFSGKLAEEFFLLEVYFEQISGLRFILGEIVSLGSRSISHTCESFSCWRQNIFDAHHPHFFTFLMLSSSLFHLFDAINLLACSPFWCFRTMIMRSLYNALRVPCSLFGLVDCMRNLLQDLHHSPLWSQCRREDASRETFLDANHPTANATNHPTHPKTRALGQLCLCIIYQSVIRVHNPNELIFSVRGRWCANLHEPTLYSCNCISRWIMRLQNFHDCPRCMHDLSGFKRVVRVGGG